MTINSKDKHFINYRSDIDGLRAVAVLSVVLFHIDPSLLPGGFIGVDIFFVISGFLITGIIIKSTEAGKFSLQEFYRRRIKRIVPVLTLVILVTLFTGHFILLPDDLERLSRSAISSQLFIANIYFTFFLDTSYFAQEASLEPLLHLWSLGVEEQFYLFWPLALTLVLMKLQLRNLLILLIFLAFSSFALGESILATEPMFAYYMLPTRAGELLAGGVCFYLTKVDFLTRISHVGHEVISWLGILLILMSLVWLTDDHSFPGFNAIPVTLGAAFLIFSGSREPTLIARILSMRIVVGIGLISYSMYLWHWPVLAFLKYAYIELTVSQKIFSFVVILILSMLSYHFVELRFKSDNREFSTVAIRQLLIPSSAIILICALIIKSYGLGLYYFDDGYRNELNSFTKDEISAPSYKYVCQKPRLTSRVLENPNCVIGSTSEPTTLLWGDSNASHYVGVIGELSDQYGFSFRNAAHSSCPPLLNSPQKFVSAKAEKNCIRSNAEVLKKLDFYSTIILAASWNTYLGREEGLFTEALESTIFDLVNAGKRVIVLGRVPKIGMVDRKCQKKSLKLKSLNCAERSKRLRDKIDHTNSIIRSITESSGARYYDVSNILCDDLFCSGIFEGQLVYYDNAHLSMKGSIKVGAHARVLDNSTLIFADLPLTKDSDRITLPWVSESTSFKRAASPEKK